MKLVDRQTKIAVEEKVYGDFFLRLAYGGGAGRFLVKSRGIQKGLSRIIGLLQKTRLSKGRISGFVKDFSINLDEYVVPAGGFKTFNDFFIRPLKKGVRPFPEQISILGSPAEGRLTAFPIESAKSLLTIKGELMSIERLVGSGAIAADFVGGYACVFRLCPVDYHRFHFCDDGMPSAAIRIGRTLHSVNPLAQLHVPDVFLSNERQVSLLESQNFGKVAFVEVGAMGVGTIHQTYQPARPVKRGDEKGYFSFGGSTVILLLDGRKVALDDDILKYTSEGTETYIRLGESFGRALT